MSIVGNKIVAPISISDLQRMFASNSSDLGTLCKNNNINKWSANKPIRNANPLLNVEGITNEMNGGAKYWHNKIDGIENWQADGGKHMLMYGLKVPQGTYLIELLREYQAHPYMHYEYLKPRGKVQNEPYRAGDLHNYDHSAQEWFTTGISHVDTGDTELNQVGMIKEYNLWDDDTVTFYMDNWRNFSSPVAIHNMLQNAPDVKSYFTLEMYVKESSATNFSNDNRVIKYCENPVDTQRNDLNITLDLTQEYVGKWLHCLLGINAFKTADKTIFPSNAWIAPRGFYRILKIVAYFNRTFHMLGYRTYNSQLYAPTDAAQFNRGDGTLYFKFEMQQKTKTWRIAANTFNPSSSDPNKYFYMWAKFTHITTEYKVWLYPVNETLQHLNPPYHTIESDRTEQGMQTFWMEAENIMPTVEMNDSQYKGLQIFIQTHKNSFDESATIVFSQSLLIRK